MSFVVRIALLAALATSGGDAAAQTLVGQPIANEKRTLQGFAHQIGCEAPAGEPQRLDGRVGGQAFRLYTLSCAFVGGNSEWSALMIGFHDGQRYTRVAAYAGGLAPTSNPVLRNGRLLYESMVEKPGDARCCPSGKALVEIDMATLVRRTQAIGFRRSFPPERPQALR